MAPRLTSSYTTPISHAVPQPAVPNPTRDSVAAGGAVEGALALVGCAVGVLAVGRALAGALVPRDVGDAVSALEGDAVTALEGKPVLGLSVLAAAGESVSACTGATVRVVLRVGAAEVNGAPVVLCVGAAEANGAPVVLCVGAADVNGAPVVLCVGAADANDAPGVGAPVVVLCVGAPVVGLTDDVGCAVGWGLTTGPVAVGALDDSCTMTPSKGLAVGETTG